MDEEQEIRDGERVEAFLNDPSVKRAFEKYEARMVKEWKDSDDPKKRDNAWAQCRVLDEVRKELRAIASAGEVARVKRERDTNSKPANRK